MWLALGGWSATGEPPTASMTSLTYLMDERHGQYPWLGDRR